MSGQPTRAGLSPDGPSRKLSARLPAEWGRFAAFLRRPSLPDRAHLSFRESLRALVPLFALDLLLMALVFAAIGVATSLGFKLPAHLLNDLKMTPWLLAFIVVGAPLGEEAIFRGWVSGRPGHIAGSVLAIPALLSLVGAAGLKEVQPEASMALGAFGGVCGAVALGLVYVLRKRNAICWFQRHFRWFYYASALLFAAIHLTNFGSSGAALTALPLVLPQLALGLLLGYLRVNRGLLTGAALHIVHNSLFAALMLAGVR
jgi:membrane protease YdiL (CAAX protease family)